MVKSKYKYQLNRKLPLYNWLHFPSPTAVTCVCAITFLLTPFCDTMNAKKSIAITTFSKELAIPDSPYPKVFKHTFFVQMGLSFHLCRDSCSHRFIGGLVLSLYQEREYSSETHVLFFTSSFSPSTIIIVIGTLYTD